MAITLDLDENQVKRLRLWSNMVITDKSHWGNAEATLPEEDTLKKKLQKPGKIEIVPSELTILFYWWGVVVAPNKAMDFEDTKITEQIINAFEAYKQELLERDPEADPVAKSHLIDVDKALQKLRDPSKFVDGVLPLSQFKSNK